MHTHIHMDAYIMSTPRVIIQFHMADLCRLRASAVLPWGVHGYMHTVTDSQLAWRGSRGGGSGGADGHGGVSIIAPFRDTTYVV